MCIMCVCMCIQLAMCDWTYKTGKCAQITCVATCIKCDWASENGPSWHKLHIVIKTLLS